jgi:hypothetical protein
MNVQSHPHLKDELIIFSAYRGIGMPDYYYYNVRAMLICLILNTEI